MKYDTQASERAGAEAVTLFNGFVAAFDVLAGKFSSSNKPPLKSKVEG